MASPAPPTNITTSQNNGVTLTWEYDVTWFAFDGDDDTLGGFNEGVWSSSDGDVRIERRNVDADGSFAFIKKGLHPQETSYTDSNISDDTTYEYRVTRHLSDDEAASGTKEVTTFLDTVRTATSYSSEITSSSIRVVNLIESVTSSTSISSATADRGPLQFEGRDSKPTFASSSTSNSTRVIDVSESTGSYSRDLRSFAYNERTSLELIDHTISWNNDEAFWYTNWFSETRILGSEDTLAIRSLVVDNAKDPAATIVVQYDGNGDGKVDEESDRLRLGQNQSVQEITGVPIDEDGSYRLKIMEYSGYNSLYALDTAIVN